MNRIDLWDVGVIVFVTAFVLLLWVVHPYLVAAVAAVVLARVCCLGSRRAARNAAVDAGKDG